MKGNIMKHASVFFSLSLASVGSLGSLPTASAATIAAVECSSGKSSLKLDLRSQTAEMKVVSSDSFDYSLSGKLGDCAVHAPATKDAPLAVLCSGNFDVFFQTEDEETWGAAFEVKGQAGKISISTSFHIDSPDAGLEPSFQIGAETWGAEEDDSSYFGSSFGAGPSGCQIRFAESPE